MATMTKKQLLKAIEEWSYRFGMCIRQDSNYYFNWGYLSCLKHQARDTNLDFTQAEEAGYARAKEFLKQEAEKSGKFQLVFGAQQ